MDRVIPPASAGGFGWGVRATPETHADPPTQKPLAGAMGMPLAITIGILGHPAGSNAAADRLAPERNRP